MRRGAAPGRVVALAGIGSVRASAGVAPPLCPAGLWIAAMCSGAKPWGRKRPAPGCDMGGRLSWLREESRGVEAPSRPSRGRCQGQRLREARIRGGRVRRRIDNAVPVCGCCPRLQPGQRWTPKRGGIAPAEQRRVFVSCSVSACPEVRQRALATPASSGQGRESTCPAPRLTSRQEDCGAVQAVVEGKGGGAGPEPTPR